MRLATKIQTRTNTTDEIVFFYFSSPPFKRRKGQGANKQCSLSTNEKTRVPEPTLRRPEYGCERLNRYRHGWWPRPNTEWPASWHRNPCLVTHRDQVRSWTGKRIGRFEWISGTKKPHFAKFQNHSTIRNPGSLYKSHKKATELSFFLEGGDSFIKKKGEGCRQTWRQTTPTQSCASIYCPFPTHLPKKRYRGRKCCPPEIWACYVGRSITSETRER